MTIPLPYALAIQEILEQFGLTPDDLIHDLDKTHEALSPEAWDEIKRLFITGQASLN